MIRWRLAMLMAERGLTAYRVAQDAGLPIPTVYRIAAPGSKAERIDATTLGKLCAALNVQPGDLLAYIDEPAKKRGKRG